jgi:hypothetical protein
MNRDALSERKGRAAAAARGAAMTAIFDRICRRMNKAAPHFAALCRDAARPRLHVTT